MLVLDYLKYLKENTIEIPPFHTGHLGFIPETEVKMGLMAPFETGASHCEIVISPFDLKNDLAIIRCTMRDEIGVVKKLVDALSYLNINIETKECSSINHSNNHSINLIVDLSTSNLNFATTRKSLQLKYRRYGNIFPIHDYRYLKIFEAIIAFCGDSIEHEDVSGEKRFSLYIHPLEKRSFRIHDKSTIKPGLKKFVQVDIPDRILNTIKSIIKPDISEDISYLIFSDTKERNLRVFFPKSETVSKMLHIGVYHKDIPGALSTILDLIASSNFNILTGLLRKQTLSESIWEGIIEFRGELALPKFNTQIEKLIWVSERLIKGGSRGYDIKDFDLRIGEPMYPWKNERELVSLNNILNSSHKHKIKRTFDIGTEVNKSLERMKLNLTEENHELLDLLSLIKNRIESQRLPSVFLSYPYGAKGHADLIKRRLSGKYDFDEYQEADGNIILNQVISKIQNCDYFIGVWHYDESLPTKDGKYNVSPWMPFELGIALSENKKMIIVHSEKLSEKVWKRITPQIAIPEYSDISFESKTLEILEKYCKEHFR